MAYNKYKNDDFSIPAHIYETPGNQRYCSFTVHIPIKSRNMTAKRRVVISMTDQNKKNGEIKKTKNGREDIIVGTAFMKPLAFWGEKSKNSNKAKL